MEKTNFKSILKRGKDDYINYLIVIAGFVVLSILSGTGILGKAYVGLLVPVCCWIIMAISLNVTVGILGELSLGHAGFMSIGAFTGIIIAESMRDSVPESWIRLILAIIIGAIITAVFGFLIGIPVLRLNGDYLAIVTLAFGEIIKELVNCLIVGVDSNGIHFIFNVNGAKSASDLNLEEGGRAIIKGAQGATGTTTIATFLGGCILLMVVLIIVQNFKRSRSGRAVMAIRDNKIAAESSGINVTKFKMIAFVISAGIAGAAGALYGLNFSSIVATKFDFNTSILVLVYVVLGGLGSIRGSIVAALVLYVLPEVLRAFSTYRMLVYAIVLILVMVCTNSPQVKAFIQKILPKKAKKGGN